MSVLSAGKVHGKAFEIADVLVACHAATFAAAYRHTGCLRPVALLAPRETWVRRSRSCPWHVRSNILSFYSYLPRGCPTLGFLLHAVQRDEIERRTFTSIANMLGTAQLLTGNSL